ncbi:MAG: hypothetical protein H6636_13835 [Anaerolineales bacterium]|nr:hypothetical protein [Anaerolineales bacterium]
MTQINEEQRGALSFDLAAVAGPGGVASVANPEGRKLVIDRVILHLETPAAVACTLDAGIAEDGETSSDNLLDGVDATQAMALDNITNKGANGATCFVWDVDEYLTISVATGTVTGLTGIGLVHYFPVD